MDRYLERTISLIGEQAVNRVSSKTIMVIGLGGVGGTAFEALVRSGFKNFIIVDGDVVDESNLNRQILFTKKDVGRSKAIVAKEKALSICEDLAIQEYHEFIDENSIQKFENFKIDYIVDAIDKIPSKIAIVNFAKNHNIPFIVSLGMGNRLDPEMVTITRLDKTENDPLAKKLRGEFRKAGIPLKDINVIFSKEAPLVKSTTISSMMMVPSTAGLLIAKKIIKDIMEE